MMTMKTSAKAAFSAVSGAPDVKPQAQRSQAGPSPGLFHSSPRVLAGILPK
jgi:hypothetical protein